MDFDRVAIDDAGLSDQVIGEGGLKSARSVKKAAARRLIIIWNASTNPCGLLRKNSLLPSAASPC